MKSKFTEDYEKLLRGYKYQDRTFEAYCLMGSIIAGTVILTLALIF